MGVYTSSEPCNMKIKTLWGGGGRGAVRLGYFIFCKIWKILENHFLNFVNFENFYKFLNNSKTRPKIPS